MKHFIFSIAITLCLLSNVKVSNAQTCNRQLDSLTLITFYNSTGGSNWLTTWDLQKPINEWAGIVLNEDGCVVRLDLHDNGLNGTIPPEIGNLKQLEWLHLTNNALQGEIPKKLET